VRAISPSSSATGSTKSSRSEYVGYCLRRPGCDTPLHVITKDSVEDLSLPTPPKITLSAPAQKTSFSIESSPLQKLSATSHSAPPDKLSFTDEEIKTTRQIKPAEQVRPAQEAKLSKEVEASAEIKPISPTKSSRKNPKSLKVQINGAEFELEKEKKRPLSPFTSGGMLRRLLSPTPPSAPAKMTAFGSTIEDEVGGKVTEVESASKKKANIKRTTQEERGGGLLSKILKRRIGRG
jgi:hypothetical protein